VAVLPERDVGLFLQLGRAFGPSAFAVQINPGKRMRTRQIPDEVGSPLEEKGHDSLVPAQENVVERHRGRVSSVMDGQWMTFR
jgi:hypothetical protein